jgi:REP element-mobilizing transposase RayT
LGTVVGENIILSEIGKIAKEGWKEIPTHFPNVTLEEFVIMPNHVHGIIVINACRDLINQIPTKGKYPLMKNPSLTLGKIIRHYKERTTKLARNSGCTGFRWQGGYYDRIIRNDKELRNIRKYIANNPIRWFFDKENPDYAESKI